MPDTSKTPKTPESQNPAQDVKKAFDTIVNAKVSAFVSLGMPEKLTPDSLNAYAGVFDKNGSTQVKEIDQQGLEALKKKFTEEKLAPSSKFHQPTRSLPDRHQTETEHLCM